MRIDTARATLRSDEGNYYYLRIARKQQYLFASIIESFSGLANHTTDRDDKDILIFFASRGQIGEFEEILNFLAGYEKF